MSTLKVEVVALDAVLPHPNADRLELAQIRGWQCVVPKGVYKTGDRAVYFPIDSILPQRVEERLFSPDAKVKLTKSRVRTIKLRGAISQGLLASLTELDLNTHLKEGFDLTEELGVVKYEPPEELQGRVGAASRKQVNPYFHKYTEIENFKNYPGLFLDNEEVVVLEKIHGTNFRAGWVPFYAHTWWQRIRQWVGLAPRWQFVYGSHNVQLHDKFIWDGFYGSNVYAEAVKNYNLTAVLRPGEVVYGEIYGDGIQKGYCYGCAAGERRLAVFDLKRNDVYLNYSKVMVWCIERGLPHVPVLQCGFYHGSDRLKEYASGSSTLGPELREGVVIKPLIETATFMGRKILKLKNDEFLLKVEDDTH